MTVPTCEEVREYLVDLADGQDVPEAAAHLDRCETCRRMVWALRESLGVAQEVWQDREARLESVTPSRRNSRLFTSRTWAIAAGIVLLVSASVVWKYLGEQPTDLPNPTAIQAVIERSAISAQLLASADLLAQEPEGKMMAREGYEYVVQHYPGTDAAGQAERQLQYLLGRKDKP